jgi:hypothetical protein
MVKLKKRIFRDELRNLCINKDWYTCGTVEQYDRLFDKLHDDMTEEEIVNVAIDIYDHSEVEKTAEEYGCSYEEVFDNIVYEVFEIVHTFVVR